MDCGMYNYYILVINRIFYNFSVIYPFYVFLSLLLLIRDFLGYIHSLIAYFIVLLYIII